VFTFRTEVADNSLFALLFEVEFSICGMWNFLDEPFEMKSNSFPDFCKCPLAGTIRILGAERVRLNFNWVRKRGNPSLREEIRAENRSSG